MGFTEFIQNFSNSFSSFLDFIILNRITILSTFFFLVPVLSIIDKILASFESSEEQVTDQIIESDDPFYEFTALDENVVQIIANTKIKFEDVAGNEEAKTELKEVVKFLKDTTSFSKLGAGVPKGVLLGGPPGTGKTLLAKAIAGEAGTPFLKVSGSQFVELLVGVGAARVRELFEKARSLKPAIIFIDEIDSIARSRSTNSSMGGGNDEREQTLNQILTEMDGFTSDTGIVVIAASNRIDILDPAIKRAGRFDRQILINNPTLNERLAILKVHSRGKKIDPSVSLAQIAQRTLGFSGADLENVLNEAAILATRRRNETITMDEINTSIDRIVIGLEGKGLIRVKGRQLTAFHEMGHAFVSSMMNPQNGVEKLTLVPRGRTQGTTWTIPSVSQYLTRNVFLNQVFIGIAGRASEELINGISECTVGAEDDLAELTRTLRVLIIRYAMSRLQELKQEAQLRNLFYLGTDIKQEFNNLVDNFTTNLMDITYTEVLSFLEIIRPGGERLVDELIICEEMNGKEFCALAQEYLSNLKGFEILESSRKSTIFNFMAPTLNEFIEDIYEGVENLEREIQQIKLYFDEENNQIKYSEEIDPKLLSDIFQRINSKTSVSI
uniref:Cell division protein n=1 Tax=Neotessella volvocina TaxID=52559 RepID=A0A3G2R0B1_9STRA|nr:cell division protein [Neotessella volvocina]